MEKFSTLLAHCEGNPPVSFDDLFYVRLHKPIGEQSNDIYVPAL